MLIPKSNCVSRFFPLNGIPVVASLVNKRLLYFNTDIESRQIDTGFNSQIEYVFNNCGYRSIDFEERGDINVLAIGCSVTFGIGIPADRRFVRVFCDKITQQMGKKVVDWNLSMPGESIDYIARLAVLAVPILKPTVLLTNFPSLARREFFDNFGNRFDYRPKRDVKNLVEQDIMNKMAGLSSRYDDLAKFFVNFKLIEAISVINKCQWLYALQKCDLSQYNLISAHCRDDLRVESLNKIDYARDNGHPGVKTNLQHGLNYYEKYLTVYG